MRNRRNYYRILHVQRDAPAEVIRSSFRAIMLQLQTHPDRGGDHVSAALVNEAYAVLSDPLRREEYDRSLAPVERLAREARALPREAPAQAQPDAPDRLSHCPFCRRPCAEGASARPGDRCAACGSPLFPAARFASAASGQRVASRRAQRREVRLFTAWPQPSPLRCEARDLSPRGVRIETDAPLRRDQIVRIDAGGLEALGRVAYCSRGEGRGWAAGIEFITVLVGPGSFVSRRA